MHGEGERAIDAVDHGDNALQAVVTADPRIRHQRVEDRRRIGKTGGLYHDPTKGVALLRALQDQAFMRVRGNRNRS